MNNIPIHDLTAPFASEQVKQRRGNFGQQLSYVEAGTVIARLNDALEGAWSFNVVESIIEPDEVIVRGRLTIGDTVREQYGGSRVTRHKDSGEIINLADDLKAASSDALKKCATLAGVALHLYGDAGAGNGHDSTNGKQRSYRNGNGRQHASGSTRATGVLSSDPDRATNVQIARVFAAARDIGLPQKDVIKLAQDTFAASISMLSPTQADDLIALIGQAA